MALFTFIVFFGSILLRHPHLLSVNLITELVLLGVYAVTATVIFLRCSNERMALFTSLFLIIFGATLSPEMDAISLGPTAWAKPVTVLIHLGPLLLLLFLYLFPSGSFVPRWTATVFALVLLSLLLLSPFGPFTVPDPFTFLAWNALLVIGIVAQIYRYRRVSSPVQRQQTKWIVFGVTCMLLGLVLGGLPRELFPSLFTSGSIGMWLTGLSDATAVVSLLILPLVFGVAILRYHLWDIDILINRTLVYGTLSATIVAVYALIVGALSSWLQANGNFLISLVAAGMVAALFQPLRGWLQRSANRLMFGERDDPYAVISRLGDRLAVNLAPDEILPIITQTVKDALRLPYVELRLRETDAEKFTRVISVGNEQSENVIFPLVSQNETLGLLVVSPRAANEPLSSRDDHLLQELARQAGAVIHAVLLNSELQQARIHLVSTREEERRRIRRDLHDGLGPVLASFVLQADAAHDLVRTDPSQTEAILSDISNKSQSAIADIRRLVYGLRPPSLDELGLLDALQLHIRQIVPRDIQAKFIAPKSLLVLPAAVEVACFRIIQEAVNNVVRHADARYCVISIVIDNGLLLIVEDDGRGIQSDQVAGVGLNSMRERAEELGGTFTIEPGARKRGTRIQAFLPILPES